MEEPIFADYAFGGGRFILEEHAPGFTPDEIAALTGAPLEVTPHVRPVDVWSGH